MVDDLEPIGSPDRKNNNLWELEPWQNQQESPCHSPERRVYVPRPSPAHNKNDRQQKPAKSRNVLEPNNHCNFSIKLRSTPHKKSSFIGLKPV